MKFVKKNIIAFIIIFILAISVGVILGIIFSLTILPLISSFSLIVQKTSYTYDHVSMLSINVGLLQGLIAIMTIFIALAGIFTYANISKEVNILRKEVKKHSRRFIKISKFIKQSNVNNQNRKLKNPINMQAGSTLIPMEDKDEDSN